MYSMQLFIVKWKQCQGKIEEQIMAGEMKNASLQKKIIEELIDMMMDCSIPGSMCIAA